MRPRTRLPLLTYLLTYWLSSLSCKDPWRLTSDHAWLAGYAQRDMASATSLSFQGTYRTSRANLEKFSCQRPRRPKGPLGVLGCSVAQASRLLWSVTTETGLLPIQVWYLRRASTIAYASFSRGDHFFLSWRQFFGPEGHRNIFLGLRVILL